MAPEPAHRPVLYEAVLAGLDPRPGEVAVDATLGLAGHALGILRRLAPGGRLVGIDRDPEMAEQARLRLEADAPEGTSWTVVAANSDDLLAILAAEGLESFDLFLCDCGLCSLHYDLPERGFSMKRPGPLDMRFDRATGPTAADVVNGASEEDLRRILRVYGEEPNAARIARAIVARRAEVPLATTDDLAELVRSCYPPQFRHGRRDPATRAFQALRIHLGDELGSLARTVRAALEGLAIGGRAAFVAFHSLEDRLIKQSLAAAAVTTYPTREAELYGRGVRALDLPKRQMPTEEEAADNPRARSAVLRLCRKVGPLPEAISWPTPPHVP